MKYIKETFKSIDIEGPMVLGGDVEFERCVFDNCTLHGQSLSESPRIHDVVLRNCVSESSFLCGAVFSNILVDGVKWRDLQFAWSCIFEHVTLRGKLGEFKILPGLPVGLEDSTEFDEAIARAYREIDWALDISEASARGITIRGIPADLVRRDPETQAVVRQKRAAATKWQDMSLGRAKVYIKDLLEGGYDDIIIVAPKGNKKLFPEILEEIRLLREAGIADPD